MKREAGMRLVVHQALKDARLLKWILAAWVLLNVSLQLLVLITVRQPPEHESANLAAVVYSTLRALLVAGFVTIPVVALQHDPGVGTTAFWFTKPIPVRVLLGGKFLLVVPVVVLLPVLLDACALWIEGVPLAATVRPMLLALALQAVWLLPVLAIAAFTTDLAQFVLGVILEVLTFVVVVSVVSWVVATNPGNRMFSDEKMPVFLVTVVAASSAVLVFAYLSRNLRRSAFAAGSAPVIVGVLLLTWPAGIRATSGPRLTSPIQVRPGAVWTSPIPGTPDADCVVSASLHLSRMRPTQIVDLRVYEGSLQYANRRLDMERFYVGAEARREAETPTAVLNAAGGQSAGAQRGTTEGAERSYSVYGRFPATACRDFAGERATLQIGVRLSAVEYRAVATLPMKAGGTFQVDTGRGEVVEVSTAADVIRVRVRQTGLDPRLGRLVQPVLRGSSSGRMLLSARSGMARLPFLSVIIPVPQHLVSAWSTFDFPDADWLSDAQIVLVESRLLGVSEKHVEIPNVILSSLPQQPPPRAPQD